MTKPVPDTDLLKREPPGEASKVPDKGPGEAGHPPPSRDERGFPHTGDKHRPQIDRQGGESTQTPQKQNRPQERSE